MDTTSYQTSRRRVGLAAAGIVVLTVLAGCGRLADDRIQYTYSVIDVYEEESPEFSARGPGNGKGPKVDDFEYEIIQTARILPVSVDGITVQANDIVVEGNTAVVAYNTAGATFAGAIQVLDVTNPYRPFITAELAFPGVDIVTLELDGNTVYFGGAIDPDATWTNERAFVARLDLTQVGSQTIVEDTVEGAATFGASPTYYFTTGVVRRGGETWASLGADPGAVYKLDSSLVPTALVESDDPEIDAFDIRDIEEYHGGIIAVAGTTVEPLTTGPATGRILVFKGDSIHDNSTVPIPDFGSAEAKATIEVYDNHYAFLGLSEAGFQVVFLRDRADELGIVESIYTLENPQVGWSDRTSTNSASYSRDLLFTANGEAGFRVFRVESSLKRDNPPGPGWLSKIGFVPFDETLQPSGDYWSANHVEYEDDSLFVAAGLGGVAIYTLERK